MSPVQTERDRVQTAHRRGDLICEHTRGALRGREIQPSEERDARTEGMIHPQRDDVGSRGIRIGALKQAFVRIGEGRRYSAKEMRAQGPPPLPEREPARTPSVPGPSGIAAGGVASPHTTGRRTSGPSLHKSWGWKEGRKRSRRTDSAGRARAFVRRRSQTNRWRRTSHCETCRRDCRDIDCSRIALRA